MPDFLLEIGTEEIPARMIAAAQEQLQHRVGDLLKRERVTSAKGEYLSAKITTRGRAAAEILAEALPREVASIYWPKNMYWRKASERFVRPVRWLVAMLDDEVIPLEFGGVSAGRSSRG